MGQWWKECVVYQIYPRSFLDSNRDGVGDLQGIIRKLDYLKWLGIGAVWLCPIYDSPNEDMGYDIRNYEGIMAEFGTMEDFDALLKGLHERGMRLIMDLVVNHTSDEHPWFVESRKSKDNPYRDYYIWRDGTGVQPPNNWSSFFTPSAWKYDETTEQWYLHLFSEKQPDLNWENPSLREGIYAMMNRWLDKGVDGFRMDVVSLFAKAPGLPDGTGIPNEDGFVFGGEHFVVQPQLHTYLREMRRNCFDGRDCMCVGEGTCVTKETAPLLVGDGRELDQLFQFDLMDIDSGSSKWDVKPFSVPAFKEIVTSWQKTLEWNTLFWSNHDQPRPVSRFGCVDTEELRVRSAKMLAVAMHLLKGTSYIYQGEEIAMTNVFFQRETELRDIESLQYLSAAKRHGHLVVAWEGIRQKGRDNARTPMQWTADANAGFSETEPWLMVNPNYKTINVKAAYQDKNSVLHFYHKLISLKTTSPALLYGCYREVLHEHPQIFGYIRENKAVQYLILCNFTNTLAQYCIPFGFSDAEVVLRNMETTSDELRPYEAIVLRCKSKNNTECDN